MKVSGITSGSPLCGSPIVLTVQANAVSESSTLAFHRIVVNVIAALEGVDTDFTVQSFHATIGNETEEGRTKTFDISSALQTVLDKYEYTPDAVTYPRVLFYVEAWEEMMINGVPMTSDTYSYPSASGQYLYAIGGRYSDYERRMAQSEFKKALRFSRKPSSTPQIVCVGETFAYTPAFTGEEGFDGYSLLDLPSGPTSVITTITEEGAQQIGGVSVYAMPKQMADRDRYEFRFINSLGVLESVSVHSLAETSANLETTQYTKAAIETFKNFSRAFYKKYDGAETIKMSSGPVDRYWQQWFVHEFLVSEHVWLFFPDMTKSTVRVSGEAEGVWLPVHITAEDTITLENRTTSDTLAVSFVVEMDDKGSVMLAV